MAAGADSIDDMGLLRHGATATLLAGGRAPFTLGSFLCSFTYGNVRQAEKMTREFLVRLSGRRPCCRAWTCTPALSAPLF
jgi:hypothetical protein